MPICEIMGFVRILKRATSKRPTIQKLAFRPSYASMTLYKSLLNLTWVLTFKSLSLFFFFFFLHQASKTA